MCTIGSAFNTSPAGIYTFKQCDLVPDTEFYEPKVTRGEGDIQYLPFLREGSEGPWAGINNYGVSFVAADAYTNDSPYAAYHSLMHEESSEFNDIFSEYTRIVSAHTDARSAAGDMIDFYRHGFQSADLLLISDKAGSYFIEYNPDVPEGEDPIGTFRGTDGFFCATNHFRILPGAVEYEMNHSTYLRLARAETILQSQPNLGGIAGALRDQYYGESELSLCRVARSATQYHTQASVVLWTDGSVASCLYLINGNPRITPYTTWYDIFGASRKTTPVSAGPETPRLG